MNSPFCGRVAQALQELADRPEVIERGWRESRIGEAFSLGDNSVEYSEACTSTVQQKGKLFASFTGKKRATVAEYTITEKWGDLLSDDFVEESVVVVCDVDSSNPREDDVKCEILETSDEEERNYEHLLLQSKFHHHSLTESRLRAGMHEQQVL